MDDMGDLAEVIFVLHSVLLIIPYNWPHYRPTLAPLSPYLCVAAARSALRCLRNTGHRSSSSFELYSLRLWAFLFDTDGQTNAQVLNE